MMTSGGEATVVAKMYNWVLVCLFFFFGAFPLLKDSLSGWGLDREMGGWSFQDPAGVSQTLQGNSNDINKVRSEMSQIVAFPREACVGKNIHK